jgi:type IV pilus assembly protein PilO
MDKTQRQKLLLIVLGLVLVGVIYYMGLPPLNLPDLSKLQADVAKLRKEHDELDRSVKTAQAQIGELDKIKKEREILEAQLKEEARRLPSERETPALLRNVETLAGKSGLVIAEVKRRPVRQQELYAEIPLEIGVGGNYRDLLKFAEQMAQLDRLVTLSEVQVMRKEAAPKTAPAADATPGTIRAQMVAVVFQTLPEAPGAGAPPKQ